MLELKFRLRFTQAGFPGRPLPTMELFKLPCKAGVPRSLSLALSATHYRTRNTLFFIYLPGYCRYQNHRTKNPTIFE